jgi:hypothetical protein
MITTQKPRPSLLQIKHLLANVAQQLVEEHLLWFLRFVLLFVCRFDGASGGSSWRHFRWRLGGHLNTKSASAVSGRRTLQRNHSTPANVPDCSAPIAMDFAFVSEFPSLSVQRFCSHVSFFSPTIRCSRPFPWPTATSPVIRRMLARLR